MGSPLFDIDEGVTYVKLHNFDASGRDLIKKFEYKYLSRWEKVPGDTYGSYRYQISHRFGIFSPDNTEYRMAKKFLVDLKDFLSLLQINTDNLKENILPIIEPVNTTFNWLDKEMTPRNEEQVEYCDFIVQEDKNLVVINAPPGCGKTIMTIIGFVKMGYRVVLTVLPRYVPIWVTAFKEKLKLTSEDVLNVSEWDMNELYDAFKNNTVNPKIVFFQLTRIDGYLKRMAEYPNDIPHLDKLFEVMRPGVRIVDEAHESIYSVYSSLMYGNLKKTVALSATLKGDDEFVNKIYNGIFPYSAYIRPPTYDKYMEVITYYHRMNVNKYRIRTEGFGGYQHTLYENSILKNKHVFERYYQMCKQAFQLKYMEGRREGQKAIFFFATVAMCNKFGERLMKDYPDEDIFVFTGEISKKKGMSASYRDHDIVISTPGSLGTGKDIPKLYIVFSGVSVSSSQRIDQMTGRLRDIKQWWPDLDPIYLTFVCRDINKQVQYDWKKKQVVKKKTKRFVSLDAGFYI